VEDRVRSLDALLQRFNGLGRWQHEQIDFARCGTYSAIIEAVQRAAKAMKA
jgi:aerobic-type carbon monoxide dehydrogenase small subunit (CoxS/CutS family)